MRSPLLKSYTPRWLADKNPKPVFMLRLASVIERDEFEAKLDGVYDAGIIYDFVLREAAISGIKALVPGDDASAIIDLIEQEHAGEPLSDTEKADLRGAEKILAKHWPEYRAAIEKLARRNRIMPTLAFCTFCAGWENITNSMDEVIPFSSDAMGNIDEDALRRIPHLMLHAVGMEAYSIQYGQTQIKNSEPLSKSSPGQETSNSGGASKKAGKSVKISGTKTPS